MLLVLLLTAVVTAGRTHFLALPTVLTEDCTVFEATLVECEKNYGRYWIMINFELAEIEQLVKDSPKDGSFTCKIPIPHRRIRNGRKITVSPLSSASGREFNLENGQRYLFISRESGRIIRVESLESKKRILELTDSFEEEEHRGPPPPN